MAKFIFYFSFETRSNRASRRDWRYRIVLVFKTKKNTYLGTVFDMDNVVSIMLLR